MRAQLAVAALLVVGLLAVAAAPGAGYPVAPQDEDHLGGPTDIPTPNGTVVGLIVTPHWDEYNISVKNKVVYFEDMICEYEDEVKKEWVLKKTETYKQNCEFRVDSE